MIKILTASIPDLNYFMIKLLHILILITALCSFSGKNLAAKYDNCILFQKITDQEKVILGILDFLDKK